MIVVIKVLIRFIALKLLQDGEECAISGSFPCGTDTYSIIFSWYSESYEERF